MDKIGRNHKESWISMIREEIQPVTKLELKGAANQIHEAHSDLASSPLSPKKFDGIRDWGKKEPPLGNKIRPALQNQIN